MAWRAPVGPHSSSIVLVSLAGALLLRVLVAMNHGMHASVHARSRSRRRRCGHEQLLCLCLAPGCAGVSVGDALTHVGLLGGALAS